jgi:hypothetical protein
MERTEVLFNVGRALSFLLASSILLADVHYNNIGKVDRPEYGEMVVITDPGHMVRLDADVIPQPVEAL